MDATLRGIFAMEAIGASNDEGHFKPYRAILKRRTVAMAALAVLLLTGFATQAGAQAGSSTIVVRAHGTAGGESITLRVDNSNVATWTLSTSYQTFSASTNLTGTVTVAFTNDATAAATCRSTTSSSMGKPASRRIRAPTPGSTRMAVAVAARTANGCIATALLPMAPSPIRPTASWCVRAARRAQSPSACASITPMLRPGR